MLHISLVGRKHLSIEIYRQVRDAIVKGTLRPEVWRQTSSGKELQKSPY